MLFPIFFNLSLLATLWLHKIPGTSIQHSETLTSVPPYNMCFLVKSFADGCCLPLTLSDNGVGVRCHLLCPDAQGRKWGCCACAGSPEYWIKGQKYLMLMTVGHCWTHCRVSPVRDLDSCVLSRLRESTPSPCCTLPSSVTKNFGFVFFTSVLDFSEIRRAKIGTKTYT